MEIENIRYIPASDGSPYTEAVLENLNDSTLNDLEVQINPLYRFANQFSRMFDVNLKGHENTRLLVLAVFTWIEDNGKRYWVGEDGVWEENSDLEGKGTKKDPFICEDGEENTVTGEDIWIKCESQFWYVDSIRVSYLIALVNPSNFLDYQTKLVNGSAGAAIAVLSGLGSKILAGIGTFVGMLTSIKSPVDFKDSVLDNIDEAAGYLGIDSQNMPIYERGKRLYGDMEKEQEIIGRIKVGRCIIRVLV